MKNNNEIEFKDMDGVTICVGDEVLVTVNSHLATSSLLVRGKVIRFTSKNCYIEHKSVYSKLLKREHMSAVTKLAYDQLQIRALVLKGEFVEYTKTKDLTNE
jgi:hypothetical protein